jgi:hypothetical protein
MKTGIMSWWRRWAARREDAATRASAAAAEPAPRVLDPAFKTVYAIFPDIEDHRQRGSFPDLPDEEFWQVVDRARPYTMLSIEALFELYQAVRYVAASRIEGDLVECGCFMGGAVFSAAEWAQRFGMADRRFLLYDTFCGFPEGTAPETDLHGNLVKMYPHPHYLAVARDLIARSSWPQDRFVFVEGDVALTLKETRPERIALLRLDTDVYASTRVELEELYPLLSPGGVLIIDDYGQFRGARRATDEFLARQRPAPLLHRVSSGVRSGIKPGRLSDS